MRTTLLLGIASGLLLACSLAVMAAPGPMNSLSQRMDLHELESVLCPPLLAMAPPEVIEGDSGKREERNKALRDAAKRIIDQPGNSQTGESQSDEKSDGKAAQ